MRIPTTEGRLITMPREIINPLIVVSLFSLRAHTDCGVVKVKLYLASGSYFMFILYLAAHSFLLNKTSRWINY